MSRLANELLRLFDLGATAAPPGTTRALVLELARPADWALLSLVWKGVQSELELPAPAIAVSGTEGLQLWFSLTEPLPAAEAENFLEALRLRWLADVARKRLRLLTAVDAAALADDAHRAQPVPALNPGTGNWSAFVAPDLAPLFADTPWLDLPPGDEGQAVLLAPLKPITRAQWRTAQELLRPAPPVAPADAPPAAAQAFVHPGRSTQADPQAFLLSVMNDAAVPLALRIEAAKALLPKAVR